MSPLMLLLTAITVALIGLVITTVVKSNANLERGRVAWNERAAYMRAQQGKPTGRAPRRRQVGAGAPRPAIAAGTDDKPGRTVATTTAQESPAADLPPLGAKIRLDDGRTGTVAAIERVARATRVHLELDGGGRGHVDIPDAPRAAPVPQPQPQPRPAPAAAAPPSPRQAPAAAPAPPAPVPAPAAATAPAAASTTVRLGGFSMPVTPAGRRS
jgi:hypothetical protein